MKRLIVLFFSFVLSCSCFSQNEELESLIIGLSFQKSDTTKIKTASKIIKLLYNSKAYDRALKYSIETERLSEELNYTRGSAEMAYFKAIIYNKKDDYINASVQFKRAATLFETLKDTLALAKIKSRLGSLEIARGKYSIGLKQVFDGIRELEKRDVKEELIIAYNGLAKAYEKTNSLEKAIDYNLKSLAIEKELSDTEGLINSNINLAHLYYYKKDFKKSIRYYENALNYAQDTNDTLRASILPELGEAYFKIGDYKLSAQYLVLGIKLNRRLKDNDGIIKSLNNLAALNLAKQQFKIAEQQLLEAGSLGRNRANKQELLKNYALMKALDSTRGDFKSAFTWQSQYYKIKSALDAEKKTYNTPAPLEEPIIESTLQLEEPTLSSTKEDNEAKRILDKYKLIFYALLGAFAIISTFFILFYLKRNNRLKYTQELEAKNKKIELQNEAILEQSKHLEDINNVKDKLFSIISHDLKDSLTSTKGFIDLLNDGQLSQEEFNSLLPELSKSANNASLLLFDLLNWSKSQMQSLKPKPSSFDVQEVFYEKVKLIEQKMQTKGIVLIDNTFPDFVFADRSMVEIIIQNLLANAVKFCKSGDSITIGNEIDKNKTIISVADSGVGISIENQHKLFDNNAFTTVGTSNEIGTGLGLSICRELVALNEGRIWVDSEPNVGSTFFVELPKKSIENAVNTGTTPSVETPQPSYSAHSHLHKSR
ncbi:ATP-binding protein [Lacinutrix sp. Hel_I_90]|uniref:tetratricopeptide repeat-containing sensor histidine kinase n=1 Tax=Lacinutrix sp. Hel_I_90 TaxID=1249999 RepID=UPI0009E55225|nr:ATP-binding protein [Lacinutrix sp. Hel_I_90]